MRLSRGNSLPTAGGRLFLGRDWLELFPQHLHDSIQHVCRNPTPQVGIHRLCRSVASLDNRYAKLQSASLSQPYQDLIGPSGEPQGRFHGTITHLTTYPNRQRLCPYQTYCKSLRPVRPRKIFATNGPLCYLLSQKDRGLVCSALDATVSVFLFEAIFTALPLVHRSRARCK